jgi:hypothetical protein
MVPQQPFIQQDAVDKTAFLVDLAELRALLETVGFLIIICKVVSCVHRLLLFMACGGSLF